MQIENLSKSFGDRVLFENLSFGIADGERIGLIAPNGTGKSTLLRIIGGSEIPDTGSVVFRRDLRVGCLEQDPRFPAGSTVLQACFHSENPVVELIARYEAALASDDREALTGLLDEMDAHKAWEYEQRVKQILSQLKISDFRQPVEELSGGQLKRVALANVLITDPDLLILDEPTNHLDLEMTEWLEEYLNRANISLLMVTHDRYFLDRVCNQILEIDRRQLYGYRGNYSFYLEKRAERVAARNSEIDRSNNLLRKELEWMRRQPQARGTKAKYRKDAFYELQEKARQERTAEGVQLEVKASYIGSKICEIGRLSKRYGEKRLVEDFSYVFARYEKLGVVGRNGTGKSTFIKMLLGEVAPDGGTIEIGETVRFGYYSQDGLRFDEQMKVIDAVQEIAEEISLGDGRKLTASQFLQHFLFAPETQHNYIYKLSGGEKRRLYLCTVLLRNPNFLVLDEPTNDLDIVTLNVLEEYLCSFKGCVIVVSHDRYFMDKVVDHLLVFEGDARLRDFPGSYTDYRAWRELREKEERESAALLRQATPKTERSRGETAASQPAKLTFKERRELESIDAEIPLLTEQKNRLEAEISSGALSTEELFEKSEAITRLMAELDEKELRWLELSERA